MKLDCLIIDDDPTFRVFLKKKITDNDSLKLNGIAENGWKAMDLLNKKEIDLIFLDIQMPDMTGFEVLDRVKDLDPTQIIITSGSEAHAIKAFDYGITDYLVKPFSEERFHEAINRVVRNAQQKKSATSPINLMVEKLLQYMHSRNLEELFPFSYRDAKLGHIYPMISSNFDFSREEKLIEILNMAENEGFLSSSYYDSFYSCNNCHNSYLIYRETCPNCQTSHVASEEQVHHFPCAYVGPISDFRMADDFRELSCPKCDRSLKHIGVDYDKPSVIFNCHQCSHVFQDPVVKAKCNHCSSDIRVENLLKKTLKSYQLTELGRDAALGKAMINITGYDDLADIVDKELFPKLLAKEIERKEIANFSSTIVYILMDNITDLYQQLGNQNSRKLLREIYTLIRNELNRSDDIVFEDMTSILMLITEKSMAQTAVLTEKITLRIKELIRDNHSGFQLGFSNNIKEVKESVSAHEQIQNLKAERSEYA
jgi:response regulator of citrate/malate metabolism/gas vesicle protein